MAFPLPQLDHAVINVANHLDDAKARFQRLGFQLTVRGHHSLGSSNHLAILGENYLELLGYEAERAHLRADLWQASLGLSGLVWKTDDTDADAIYRHLQRQDLAGDEPVSFHRPVTLPDGEQTAGRFRTVRLRADSVPQGRSFFCQHLTPHAVWQSAWQRHPNGVTNISEFVIVAQDPQQAAAVYGRLFGVERLESDKDGGVLLRAGAATVRFLTELQAVRRFYTLPDDYQGTPRMAALSLKTTDLAQVKRYLQVGSEVIPFYDTPEAIVVPPTSAFNLALRFHQ